MQRVEERKRAEKQHEDRTLWYWDDDGSLVVKGRLPPEQGALLIKALEAARETLYQDDPWTHVPAGTSRTESKSVPAGTSEAGSENVPAGTSGNGVTSIPDDWDVPKPDWAPVGARHADALVALAESYVAYGPAALSGGDRYQVTVHIDAAVLDDVDAEGRADIEDGPWISSDTVRQLACESSVVQMLDDRSGLPLDVGRRTRSIPPRHPPRAQGA